MNNSDFCETDIINLTSTLTTRELALEILRLRRDCAEAYQAVGNLTNINHPSVERLLDNLLAASAGETRPHNDLLPFSITTK
jgi:hypothetical protein